MDDSLANDLAYLEGKISVALRRDADKKLKCKQGYVQRGSACQKIEGKKGGNLARNIGIGLGAAALAGGVAVIAANKSDRQSTPAQPSPATNPPRLEQQAVKAPESKAKRRLVIAAGVATASYLGATAISRADKDGEIAAVASLLAVSPILIKSDQIDRAIASSPLSSKTKKDAENLVGATKLMLMKKIIMGSGYDLESVDKDNNSFTYKSKKTGDIQTVGSAGSALLVFNSAPTKKDGNTFKMGFQVNIGFNRNTERPTDTSKALIKMAGAAFQEHLKLLPDNCVVGCLVADDDGAGSKRGAIYKRAGFAPVPEAGNLDLYAVKVDGELKKIKTDEDKKLVVKMAKG